MNSKAKESSQIQKYRRKLKKQMETENAMMNEAALQKVKQTIKQWISRHQGDRVNLQEKTITLFDENRHPASIESKFVQGLFAQLAHEKPLKNEP